MNISNYHVLNSKILVIGQNEKYLKILLNFNINICYTLNG